VASFVWTRSLNSELLLAVEAGEVRTRAEVLRLVLALASQVAEVAALPASTALSALLHTSFDPEHAALALSSHGTSPCRRLWKAATGRCQPPNPAHQARDFGASDDSCPVCMDEFTPAHRPMRASWCAHVACQDCWAQHIHNQVASRMRRACRHLWC